MESDSNKFLIFSLLIIFMMIIFVLSHHLIIYSSPRKTGDKQIKNKVDVTTDIRPTVIKNNGNLGTSDTGVSDSTGIRYDQKGNPISSSVGTGESGRVVGDGRTNYDQNGNIISYNPNKNTGGTASVTGKSYDQGTGAGTSSGTGIGTGTGASAPELNQGVQSYIQNMASQIMAIVNSTPSSTTGQGTGGIFNPYLLTTMTPVSSSSVSVASNTNSSSSYNLNSASTSITSFSPVTTREPSSANSSLASSLTNYIYLGKVKVSSDIVANTNSAMLTSLSATLTTGMYVEIDNFYYALVTVSPATFNFSGNVSNTFDVTFDKNIPTKITSGSSLDLYTSNSSNSLSPSTSNTPMNNYSLLTSTPNSTTTSTPNSTTTSTPNSTTTSTPGNDRGDSNVLSTSSGPISSTSSVPVTTSKPAKKINYPYSSTGLIVGVSGLDVAELEIGDTVMFSDNLSTGVVYIIDYNSVLDNYVLYVNQLKYVTPTPSPTSAPPIPIPYPIAYGGYIEGVPESLASKLKQGDVVLFNDKISTGTIYLIDKNTVMNNYNMYINNLKYVTPTPTPSQSPTPTIIQTPTPTLTITPTPTRTITSTTTSTPQTTSTPTSPPRQNYVLHLSNTTTLDNPLFFVPYADVSIDELQTISELISVSPEIFTVREGLGSYGTGENSDLPKTCAYSQSGTTSSNSPITKAKIDYSNTSLLYITDCLFYPIYSVKFKNNTLILQLDSSDTSQINSGYYRLVI